MFIRMCLSLSPFDNLFNTNKEISYSYSYSLSCRSIYLNKLTYLRSEPESFFCMKQIKCEINYDYHAGIDVIIYISCSIESSNLSIIIIFTQKKSLWEPDNLINTWSLSNLSEQYFYGLSDFTLEKPHVYADVSGRNGGGGGGISIN